MAKYLFITAFEINQPDADAEKFAGNIRNDTVMDLETIEGLNPNLVKWAVGDLVAVSDQADVKDAVGWLS